MQKFTILIASAVALALGSGYAIGQGHRGGARDGAGAAAQGGGGGSAGGWQGGGNRGAWNGGNRGSWSGQSTGGRGNWNGQWNGGGRGNWNSRYWNGNRGNWNGARQGWYGGRYYPRYSVYGGVGVWPYAVYPYPYYAPPYPVYADPGPTVYVEQPQPAPIYVEPPRVAAAPEPAPPPPTPTPPPAPDRFERFTLRASELFEFDRYKLRMPQPKLDDIADALARNPQINHVTITGYTDRIGSDSYNLKLSQRRAESVKNYLVQKGVASGRLSAVGKGKADPVVQCPEMERAALIKCLEPNRRVVVEQITVERRIRQ